MTSDDWKAGFAAARHQAANLVGNVFIDEADEVDLAQAIRLGRKCVAAIKAMEDNGTRPE